MKKRDLVGAKPGIEKLIEEMERNLDRRIAEEKAALAKSTAKK